MAHPNLPAKPGQGHQLDVFLSEVLHEIRSTGLIETPPRKAHVVLLADTSTSMVGEKLAELKSGCELAAEGVLARGDELSIVSFGDAVEIVATNVASVSEVRRSLRALRASGSTPMDGAIALARKVLRGHKKGVLHVITDGMPDDRVGTMEERNGAISEGHIVRCTGVTGADAAYLRELAGGEHEKLASVSGTKSFAQAIEANTLKALPP